jgi:hypothetical protein
MLPETTPPLPKMCSYEYDRLVPRREVSSQ